MTDTEPLLTPPEAGRILGRTRRPMQRIAAAAHKRGDPAVALTPSGYRAPLEWWQAQMVGRRRGRPSTKVTKEER